MAAIDLIERISPLEIKRIFRWHWNSVPKEPFNLNGEPSTVKSEGIYQGAFETAPHEKCWESDEPRQFFDWNRKNHSEKLEAYSNPGKYFIYADYRASETDIGELRIQDIRADEPTMSFKYNLLFATLSKPEAMGVLFFDEMNLASNMIKAQFYKVINDHAIGDIPLSKNVLCISAGNEAEHSRGVTEDPVPLVLRRANYFLRPLNHEEFNDYMLRKEFHEHIIGFLAFQPQNVHRIAYDLSDGVGQACPREWSKLNNVVKSNPGLSVDDVQLLATGFVGQAVGKQFAAYVRSARKVNIDEIIRNPSMVADYEADTANLSLVYAVVAGVVERYRNDRKIIKPAFEMTLHFKRPEFGGYMLRSMKALDETVFRKAGGDTKLVPNELMDKVIERYAKLIFKNIE